MDIGTEYIKALLVEIRQGVPCVCGIGKKHQKVFDSSTKTIGNIHDLVHHCRHAIEEAKKMAKKDATSIIIGISSEYIRGMNIEVEYERDDRYAQMSMTELKNILHKSQRQTYESARKELSKTMGIPELDIELITSSISSVFLDGYKVANPIGFQGKQVKLSLYHAFAPLSYISGIQNIAGQLGYDVLGIYPEMFALSQYIIAEKGADFSGIFVDIGGSISNIGCMHQGVLVHQRTIPLGGRIISKRIAHAIEKTYEIGETVKINYAEGHLHDDERKQVSELIAADIEVWMTGFQMVLEGWKNEMLPPEIVLCGGGSLLPEIMEYFEKNDLYKTFAFSTKEKVSLLTSENHDRILFQGRLDPGVQFATSFGLALLSSEMTGKQGLLSKTLNKLIHMIKI